MAAPAILKIDVIADATKALRALGQTEAKSKGLSSNMKLAMAGAATAVTAFGVSSVKEFVAAEEAQKALSDAFERFPALAGTSQAELQKLNEELQRKTKFDDDAIASGQAVAAQFGITGDQLQRLTPLMVDYASRTGKDIPSAAQDVGKAMLGNAKALKNIGIKYTATGDKAADFENIMGLLNQQVGGFAEKEGTTAAGQAAILQNQFGELQETVGGALVPVLMKLAPILQDVAAFVEKNVSWLVPLAAGIGGVVLAWKAWNIAIGIWNALGKANVWVLALTALIAVVILVVKHWDKIKAAFAALFDWVKRNWPTLLAILTGPFGVAVLAIVRNWDTIKRAAKAVFDWITGAARAAWSFVSDQFRRISDAISGVMRGVSETARRIVDALKRPINAFIRGWNRIKVEIPSADPLGAFGPSIGGMTLRLPHIPELATGGSVLRTGLAMVHRGEQFSGVGRTLGGSTTINVHVTTTGLGADSPQIQRAVVNALRGWAGRNGGIDIPIRAFS